MGEPAGGAGVTPEGETKAKLKRWFKAHGIYNWWPVQTGYGAATVDCLSCWNGRFVAIECKREGVEEPSPRQAATMREMRKSGAVTCLVTLKDGELKWIELR